MKLILVENSMDLLLYRLCRSNRVAGASAFPNGVWERGARGARFILILLSSVLTGIIPSFGADQQQYLSKSDAEYMIVAEAFVRADSKQDYAGLFPLLPASVQKEYKTPEGLQTNLVSAHVAPPGSTTQNGETHNFIDVKNVRFVKFQKVKGNDTFNYSMILFKEQESWRVLFCSPSPLEQVFAKNLSEFLPK